MGDGKDAQCIAFDSIHPPIGKASEGKAAGLPKAWCAGFEVFAQHGDAGFDLQREIYGRLRVAFVPVPIGASYCFIKRKRVKGETHADQWTSVKEARRRAKASSPSIHFTSPRSIASTRRAISSSHAAAMASGVS
ncbi:hypothetical protein ABDB87_05455 [Uliginosibacterium paludis]